MPLKLTESAWLYQPFESGARAGVARDDRTGRVVAEGERPRRSTFPARSRQEPLTEAFASSGPE